MNKETLDYITYIAKGNGQTLTLLETEQAHAYAMTTPEGATFETVDINSGNYYPALLHFLQCRRLFGGGEFAPSNSTISEVARQISHGDI